MSELDGSFRLVSFRRCDLDVDQHKAPPSPPALAAAASTDSNKHMIRAWQLRAAGMHKDQNGPASQDEQQESFLANIDRIKTRQGSYPDIPMSLTSRVHGAIHQAQEGLGWLRHVIQDPEDVAAAAMGRMVSKEYGKHERSHTERHAWRSPRPSPPSSPAAPTSPVRQQQQQLHVSSPFTQAAAAQAGAGGDGSTAAAGGVYGASAGSLSPPAGAAVARQHEQTDL